MKKIYKSSASTLAALMLATALVPTTSVFASEKENVPNTEQSSIALSETQVSAANPFIHFNAITNTFQVDSVGLMNILSQSEYEQVIAQVAHTNRTIEQVMNAVSIEANVRVVDSNGSEISLHQVMTRGRGINDVEFYWNYARIFVDAGNLNLALQVGFGIAGIYAPAKIVQAVCLALGIGASQIDHGIWFDYNYFIGVLCGNFGLQ